MKLFRRTSQPWPPAWAHDAGAVIWRFLFDGEGRIIGEARDPERKQARFFCLRERDGAVIWDDLRLGEPWWVGIEGVDAGRLYLHGYRKPDMPQHLGITAVDIPSGEQLWHNDEYAFVLALNGEVYAARETFGGMQFYRLSAGDGSVAEEFGQDMNRINTLRREINEEDIFRGYRYPEPLGDNHPHGEAVTAALHDMVDTSAVRGDLDVLFEPPLLMAAWHEPVPERKRPGGRTSAVPAETGATGGTGTASRAAMNAHSPPVLQQRFEARDLASGRTLYSDVILEEAEAPGMDSFFVKDDQLMYIKNRSILTAHDLNGVPA